MDAQRHQLELVAGSSARVSKVWVPGEWRCDLAAIRQRHHQFVGSEGYRDRSDIADVNL